MRKAARFAAAFASLYAAHQIGDHHIQRHDDAQNKGMPGGMGRAACARHVASYTAACAAALALTSRVTGAKFNLGRVAAGLVFSAASHYVIDRRKPLQLFADAIGKGDYYRFGQPRLGRDDNPTLGTGAYALDQSAHVGCLFVAALIAAGGK